MCVQLVQPLLAMGWISAMTGPKLVVRPCIACPLQVQCVVLKAGRPDISAWKLAFVLQAAGGRAPGAWLVLASQACNLVRLVPCLSSICWMWSMLWCDDLLTDIAGPGINAGGREQAQHQLASMLDNSFGPGETDCSPHIACMLPCPLQQDHPIRVQVGMEHRHTSILLPMTPCST